MAKVDGIQNYGIVEDGKAKNSMKIYCSLCPSLILQCNSAEQHMESRELPAMTLKAKQEEQVETFTEWWLVKGMMTFENVGFSNTVGGEIKYLICADCEQGPIGWCTDQDRDTLYVAHRRVAYKP